VCWKVFAGIWISPKPWPADRNAASDRFSSSENGRLAGENNGVLSCWCVVRDMCSMERNARCCVGIRDVKNGVSWSCFFSLEVGMAGDVHRNRLVKKEK